MKIIFVIFGIFFLNAAALGSSNLPREGFWKFELHTKYAQVPFIIEFIKNNQRSSSGNLLSAKIHNGKEIIDLEVIKEKKTFILPLQTFESFIEITSFNEHKIEGRLVKKNKSKNNNIPIIGKYGLKEKFSLKEDFKQDSKSTSPTKKLNQKWSINLINNNKKTSQGLLILEQDGHHLNGTLLTKTGDYRYFSGKIHNGFFKASSFDGGYNYLIQGKIVQKSNKNPSSMNIEGEILSSSKTTFYGEEDRNKAKLPDPFTQTQAKELDFKLPHPGSTKLISIHDPQFKNKALIIQIFGSWCPNCLDELKFLIPWYQKNKTDDFEIITLAFERSLNKKMALIQIKKTIKKYNIPFPVLMGGYTDQDKPEEKIKGLQNFISYPTTIFLDKNHTVIKVHAGFTGPSTGEFYQKFKDDFSSIVKKITGN